MTEPRIEVAVVDGHDCLFALFIRPTNDGRGVNITTSANGLSREGAVAALRSYADALESGAADTRDLPDNG